MFYLLEEGRRVFGTFAKLIIFSMAIHFNLASCILALTYVFIRALASPCGKKSLNKVETKQLHNASLLIQETVFNFVLKVLIEVFRSRRSYGKCSIA